MGRGFALLALILTAAAPQASLRDEAGQALKKAATFYRTKVARHGGYVYYTSLDLQERWGEGKALPDQIFVQPPGTPTVGLAYLRAYAATRDPFYLESARETAEALVFGQLESGGWTQTINFGTGGRPGKYRGRPGGNWNASSLDDGQTQTALRFLALADQALGFKHEKIHEAALYGFDALLKAQFPNGAFPQVWTGPVAAKPVVKASVPDYDWRTEGRIKNYWDLYTLNDGLAGTVCDTLMEAHHVYGDARHKAAIEKLGDFLILAQMPDPQPGWCQQYNDEMKPVWARKFEPPAITGGEGQDVMRTLIRIHRFSGEKRFLEPIAKALAYYRKLVLPGGRLARYYELKTDKPLYMDGRYQLTYDDSAAPSHYGWKVAARLDAIEKELLDVSKPKGRPAAPSEAEIRKILAALDAQGRWVTTHAGEGLVGQPKFAPGFSYLDSAVFSRNVETLSDYLAAPR